MVDIIEKKTSRCFIALDLPENIINEVNKIQEKLKKKKLFFGKYIELQNIHLTLKFLNEIADEQIEKVKEKLKEIKSNSFETEITEAGVFSEDSIRIVWLKLSNVDELQAKIDDILEGTFPKENRFMSHLTMARVKTIEDKEKLISLLKEIKFNIKGRIKYFTFFKSTLTKEGPIYEVIEKYELK